MECNKAYDLIMKYMDNALDKSEAEKLNLHIKTCDSCSEDFLAYDEMLTGFKDLEIIEAPGDFEAAVLAKIANQPVYAHSTAADNFVIGVWSALSVMIGLCFILVVYRDSAMAFLASVGLGNYIEFLSPFGVLVTKYAENVMTLVNSGLNSALVFFAAYKYVLLGIFVALAGLQYFIGRLTAGRDSVKLSDVE